MKKQSIILSVFFSGLMSTSLLAQKGEIYSTIEVTHPTCHNGNNGSIQLDLNPLGAPYQVLWSNGVTTPLNTGLTPGTYGLTLIDVNGDTITDQITLQNPEEILISASVDQPSSSNGMDGSIDVTIQNAGNNYIIEWSTLNGAGLVNDIEDQQQLNPGSYTLIVENELGCWTSIDVNLLATPDPISTPVSGVSSAWQSNGFQGTYLSSVHPGSVLLRTGENSIQFELFDLNGRLVSTPGIEVGTSATQQLDLEKGYYFAVFVYRDHTSSKQFFLVN